MNIQSSQSLTSAPGRTTVHSSVQPHSPVKVTSKSNPYILGERLVCCVCNRRVDPQDSKAFVPIRCHVRAFADQTFQLWRCETCQTIHCRQVVDLAHYYSKYPFALATLTWPFRLFYRQLRRRLKRYGLGPGNSLLDYGCGRGIFVNFLRDRGFSRATGYDPYGATNEYGDPAILRNAPFDFILLQDVLEHVEDAPALLREMDPLLAPGGHIFVGTPNAAALDLAHPSLFLNELHAPYHLHIYTRQSVEKFGRAIGWEPVGFSDRPYHDLSIPFLNNRATKVYQKLLGGTMDAVFEPIGPRHILRALTNPSFLFHSLFGYWLSYRSDMTVVFRKPLEKK